MKVEEEDETVCVEEVALEVELVIWAENVVSASVLVVTAMKEDVVEVASASVVLLMRDEEVEVV
jgi:hypothetical protein